MELPPLTAGNDQSSTPFEWSDLLDLSIDDEFLFNLDDNNKKEKEKEKQQAAAVWDEPSGSSSDRVRKRDPRMICENFLAGRVPCACPELDAKAVEEEEEEVDPGKKRPRIGGRTPGPSVSKCQVPGCHVDIQQLKGYHRRHRVCLSCANATSVFLDGHPKRYCQQCGKFHVLSDFDQGKRSCRRKLERHNNRRRRKAVEKDAQPLDIFSDAHAPPPKDNPWSSIQIADGEDSKDGAISNLCSALDSQNIESDSILSLTQVDKVIDNSEQDHSPPSDNKSAYSSVCPTGRISFKLYDWNPAEFPRRLRHQIFQWLASMPVELEGYIRPGCTILTIFVSMPKFMWGKLYEDPVSYLQSSVGHGGMLSGKGAALVYLNDLSFRVTNDGASVMKVKVAVRTPKLHYVYPPCFEAGKPIDLIACGSNLLQPKFRSLISFAGKYLAHDYCIAFPREKGEDESAIGYNHQFCRIYVPHTEPSYFGPAFIEVENECGLSNFIPVLIGDEHVCSEIKRMHEKYDCSYCSKTSYGTCKVSCSRQAEFSEFMLDVAWLLKQPCSDKLHCVLNSCQIQRFNCLLKLLISSKSTCILKKVLQSLENSSVVSNQVSDTDRRLFQRYLSHAREFLDQCQSGVCMQKDNSCLESIPRDDDPTVCQVEERRGTKSYMKYLDCHNGEGESVSLMNGEVSMIVNDSEDWPRKLCNQKLTISRPFVYAIAVVAVCFGLCAIVFHSHKVTKLAVSIRRCVFDNSA